MVFKVGDLQYFHTNFDKFERKMFPAGHAHIQFFNATSAIFQLYHGENKLILNEMMMRSALF
jgi:hypothetical protein